MPKVITNFIVIQTILLSEGWHGGNIRQRYVLMPSQWKPVKHKQISAAEKGWPQEHKQDKPKARMGKDAAAKARNNFDLLANRSSSTVRGRKEGTWHFPPSNLGLWLTCRCMECDTAWPHHDRMRVQQYHCISTECDQIHHYALALFP